MVASRANTIGEGSQFLTGRQSIVTLADPTTTRNTIINNTISMLRETLFLGQVEKFMETDICPKLHDRYVKTGKWESHILYCVCDCSYCQEAKLRSEYHEKRGGDRLEAEGHTH
jgi:hypothetical protein